MRDWTFKTASVDWQEATARLEFSSDRTLKVIRAVGLSDMPYRMDAPQLTALVASFPAHVAQMQHS